MITKHATGRFHRGRFKVALLLSILCAIICLVVRAAEVTFTFPPETAKLKSGPGVELASQCLICHSADYISTQPRLTRAVWKVEVIKMQQKYGAPIATNQVDLLVDYLTKNYGVSP